MKTGTKSLLFGVHQVLWHPITVWMAWVWLYRKAPSWRETICIVIHDWGYWGKANMDDEEGERHPEFGAHIAERILGSEYAELCLLHSRHYARKAGEEPSMLCWPDKLSIVFEPWWIYLPRAWASGELAEYRDVASDAGFIDKKASHREWHAWVRDRLIRAGREKRSGDVTCVNPARLHQ